MKQNSTSIKSRLNRDKSGSTIFARGVIYLVGIAALAVCFILLPELAREEAVGKPANPLLTYTFLGTAYILAAPFFIALYQSLKLLHYIDRNKAFSHQSIKTLQNIKQCAVVFSVLIVVAVLAGMLIARSLNPQEDVTFMVPLGFMFTTVSGVIAVFVAVLQKLLIEAVAMKSENDLII